MGIGSGSLSQFSSSPILPSASASASAAIAFTSDLAPNDNGRSSGQSSGQVTIRQNDDFTSALSITSVTRDQSGTYTCRVQNDAATVTHSAQLKVNGTCCSFRFFCVFLFCFLHCSYIRLNTQQIARLYTYICTPILKFIMRNALKLLPY